MEKNYLLLLGILLSTASIWAQSFWSEDFSEGNFPTAWTTEDITDVGMLWKHCANSYDCPPFSQNASLENTDIDLCRLESRSAFNGYLFVNPEGAAASSTDFDSQLTTSKIDCSNKNRVVLAFSSNLIYVFRKPAVSAFIRVKNENNDFETFEIYPTWDEGPIGEITSTWNAQTIYVDITAAAAGFSEVEIQWQWQGFNDFNWAIDDVEIFDYHPLYEKAIWGTVTGEGDFSEGLNDWQLGTNEPQCSWTWNAKGWIDNQFPQQEDYLSICSHTPENGAAILNATFCAPQNIATLAHLISPSIDLSGVAMDCELSLRFFQQVEIGNAQNLSVPITSLSWSIAGENWTDPLDVNPLAEFQEIICGEKNMSLPAELIGETDIRFRFTFSGFTFYWAIDDVRVMQNETNDLGLKENFYAIAPNYQTPKSQLDSFGLLVDFKNYGKELQEEVTVTARIFNGENQELIYEDFLNYDTVESLQLIENKLFADVVEMPEEPGVYYGQYEVNGTTADQNLSNNMLSWEFEVTDSIFAKDRGYRSTFAPVGPLAYEIGNCFYVPNGNGFHATKMTFAMLTRGNFFGALMKVRLYKWNISSPLDSIAEGNELELIGAQNFVNTETSTGIKEVTVSIEPIDEEEVWLADNSYYLATITYEGPPPGCTGDCSFYIAATDEFNYAANYFLSRNLMGSPRFASVLRQGTESDFNTIGFNFKRTPVIRLHISENIVATDARELTEKNLSIFPNPSKEMVFVSLSGVKNKEPFQIIITNSKGVEITNLQDLTSHFEQISVSIAHLISGFYVLRVLLADGQSVAKKFVKMN
ncbi:MAG: hypothetical protein ACI9XO_002026 [Paraglaciecola sp.]|jgi:hypothetical protein